MNLPTTASPASSTIKPSTPAATSECGNCGSHNPWVLHHVRLRGLYRRLCTSCVLRLHPASFCPSCFSFYDSSLPPPSRRLSCSNCSSFTHSHCASSSAASPYLCPPCANPDFSFFRLPDRTLDKRLALALLCAAKIASSSMAKAVIVARAEADRRVREAAVARKRARESLDHVAFLAFKDKARLKEDSAQVSISGNVGLLDKDKVSLEQKSLRNPPLPAQKVTQHAVQGLSRNLGPVEGDKGNMQNAGLINRDVSKNNGNGTVNLKDKSGSSDRLQNSNGDLQHFQNTHVQGDNIGSS